MTQPVLRVQPILILLYNPKGSHGLTAIALVHPFNPNQVWHPTLWPSTKHAWFASSSVWHLSASKKACLFCLAFQLDHPLTSKKVYLFLPVFSWQIPFCQLFSLVTFRPQRKSIFAGCCISLRQPVQYLPLSTTHSCHPSTKSVPPFGRM